MAFAGSVIMPQIKDVPWNIQLAITRQTFKPIVRQLSDGKMYLVSTPVLIIPKFQNSYIIDVFSIWERVKVKFLYDKAMTFAINQNKALKK